MKEDIKNIIIHETTEEKKEFIKNKLLYFFELNYSQISKTRYIQKELNTLGLIEMATSDALFDVCDIFTVDELDILIDKYIDDKNFIRLINEISYIYIKKVEVEDLKNELLDKLRKNEDNFKKYYEYIKDLKNNYIKKSID